MRWPDRQGLLVHVVLVVGVTALTLAGLVPRWPGAVHLVALPPLDLAADLRWILARAPSWPIAVAAVALSLSVRTGVLAALLGDPRRTWRTAALLHLVAFVPVLLAAQLDFIAHAVLYSRLFGGGLALLGLTFLVTAGLPWTGQRRPGAAFRRNWRAGLRVVDLALYAVALTIVGAVAEVVPPPAVAALVPVSGALTLVVVARLRAPVPPAPRWRLAGVTVLGLAVFAAVVVTRGTPWAWSQAERDGSVLIMSGINSRSGEGAIFELEPGRLGYTCDQFAYFSYAGPGDGQPRGSAACPKTQGAPYEPEDTQRPFGEQVDLLVEQASALEPPVVVLAHSQAAWVAWQAASEDRVPGLTAVVLVGPFPASPIGYPPPDHDGPGRVGGDLLRVLAPISDLVEFDFVVDAPLSRELLATPDASGAVFDQPIPDEVPVLAVTATSDLALMPDGWRIAGAEDACPVREAHPYLPITPAFHDVVDRFLDGEPPGTCPVWPDVYRTAAQAFGAPPATR